MSDLYQNKYAGYETYFTPLFPVRTGKGESYLNGGYEITNVNGKWICRKAQYYNRSLKDNEDFPVVGKVKINILGYVRDMMLEALKKRTDEQIKEDAKPEIMADGTLHITVNADVANIDRILLSQEGTHYGDLYYKDDEKPERKTGQWILTDAYAGKRYRCSECYAFALKTDDGKENLSDYCPVCGARMEGENDGTD